MRKYPEQPPCLCLRKFDAAAAFSRIRILDRAVDTMSAAVFVITALSSVLSPFCQEGTEIISRGEGQIEMLRLPVAELIERNGIHDPSVADHCYTVADLLDLLKNMAGHENGRPPLLLLPDQIQKSFPHQRMIFALDWTTTTGACME